MQEESTPAAVTAAFRVIVTGAMTWSNQAAIRRELAKLPPGSTVVHGDCSGADALAGQIARQLGLRSVAMSKNKQDYAKFGRSAWKGLNERMLARGVQLVLAFHPNIEASRGTRHMVEIARAAKVEVQIFTS
ncbi:SLOG family protein [Parachitinimonas caeni]|uniref:SLOG family protein n=1 Tax=Parachitinimonas caeni TaxID=3031301 RepID=A0ABT7DUZ6_9NEIS|nr:SLOG family protein [Parachitinimonas caeni]MDK2123877.1 SLOG family protein [Parachitinimonas caeni]